MRRTLSFACEGAELAATLDEAAGISGVLIVSGGNEIRCGAHRGMAELAADIARAGHPVFRFDRRGVGDSAGTNGGFRSSGFDLTAALAAFRTACPQLTRVVGFGNCDAATALVLHDTPVDARVLANPWIIEPVDDLPPPAAIKARYVAKLRDPAAWRALLTGGVDIAKLARGLGRIAAPSAPATLAAEVLAKIGARPTTILLAERDATAQAFAAERAKAPVAGVEVMTLDSASHSFAREADYAVLLRVLLGTLTNTEPTG